MTLVETHIIKPSDKYFKELDNLCFLSKNLYNATLYAVRQHYIKNKEYLNYYKINKIFTEDKQVDYIALPRKVSKHVQQLVEQDFKSFFALLKKQKDGKYDKKIHLPRYADKVNGRKPLHYEKGALSFKKKKGFINLSKTNIFIKSKISEKDIKFVSIVPCGNCIKIMVGYNKKEEQPTTNNRYASIDLGLNNFATISSNVMEPFIINGKPLKSINHYSNKLIAHYQSLLPKNTFNSKRIQNIRLKRENKINDYLHKSSSYIVNHLVSNNIKTLVIGYNKEWKQDINMGKVNNQNFVEIPFYKFISILTYKCELQGIQVVKQEESYTSKCSFLDDEDICKHKEYKGNRIYRGLYKSYNGQIINADLNGSLNILKKYLQKNAVWNAQFRADLIQVCSKPILYRVSI